MAQDSNKGETYACMFVLVSAGEAGEDVIAKGGLSGESKDYTKLIKCLEESVTPSTHYIEDCINYFFCKQGDMSIRQYQSEAERLIERMIPAYNATSTITHLDLKKFLLRNLLLVGLKDKNVLKDCQKLQQKDCTVESIIDLALQAEFRETTNARISKTINSSHQSSALQNVMTSQAKTCRWCGAKRLCKRRECPAYGSECSHCHRMGPFARVCLQEESTQQIQPPSSGQQKKRLHKVNIDQSPDSDGSSEDEASVYDFNPITTDIHNITSEHIKPLWVSISLSSHVHQIDVEIDTGAACNIMIYSCLWQPASQHSWPLLLDHPHN
jgi:hypothetical protein